MNINDSSIRVVCRVRPLNATELTMGGQTAVNFNEKTIRVKVQGDEGKNEFTFDNIFGPESKQSEIFNIVAKPIVDSVVRGFNGTIFAYGQTSSGKTFTMEGPSIDSDENKGIIPRMMDEVFDCIMRANESIEFTVKVSFLEIYNEKIHDLLDPRKNNLHIKEEKSRGIYVQDATEIYVNNVEQMKRVMKTGAENRTIAATKMNERSSRSHSIFILSLFQKDLDMDTIKQSSLFFVDLAGSEKIAKTHVTGQQLEEAKNINKSLSALGNVINALTSEKKEHIPYRDSKLTRILQESLGGNSKTTLILACSPCTYNDKETLGTLRFGNRAKSIKNTPIINEEKSTKELKNLLEQAERKIQQQEIVIERLECELKKIGQADIELRIVEELEKGATSSAINNSNLNAQTIKNPNMNTPKANKESSQANFEGKPNETPSKTPIKATTNNSLKLLKQHIMITSLSEENRILKYEKKDLEKALMNRNKEIYSLNDKFNYMEDNMNNIVKKYSKETCANTLRMEKLFHENQIQCHFLLKLKTDLTRLKGDLNFMLLGNSLKILDTATDLENNKHQITENIHGLISLIEGIEEMISERNLTSLTKIPTNDNISQNSKPPMEMEIDNIGGENYSNSDDFNKSDQNSESKSKQQLFDHITQKTEGNEGKKELYPKALLTEGDFIDEKVDTGGSSLGFLSDDVLLSGEATHEEMKHLIVSQRKVIESLNRNNQEMNSRVESYNSIVEKKVKKYKEKIKELTESSGNRTNDFLLEITQLKQIIEEKQMENDQNRAKYEKEIAKKNQELKELKLHLDQFQKFIVGNKPEPKGLLDYERRLKELLLERQKLFNEISTLRRDNDEKIKAIGDKSTQIFSLQSKLTNLTTQYESLKLRHETKSSKFESPSKTSRDSSSPRSNQRPSAILLAQNLSFGGQDQSQSNKNNNENCGFIDKHIIRPIRGGGGDPRNFKRNNNFMVSQDSSDSAEEEKANNKTGGLPTEEVSNPSSKDSPDKKRNSSLQQSFKAFDSILKGKDSKEKGLPSIETKRILGKSEIVEVGSGLLKSNRVQLSLLDEVEDVDIEDMETFNKKINLERKFKHISSNNNVVQKDSAGAKTGKNIFNKLKKFFV